MKLTHRGVERLQVTERKDYSIDDLRGLSLRVSLNRGTPRKTFRWSWFRDGKRSILTLGDVGPLLTIERVRSLHAQCAEAARTGGDPEKVVADFWKDNSPRTLPAPTGGPTVADCAEAYLKFSDRKHKEPARRMLDVDVLPFIGDREAATIKRADLVNLFQRVVDRGSPTMANRVHELLKAVFAVAADREIIDALPLFPKRKLGGKEEPRTRVLSDEELRRVWTGLETLPYEGSRGNGISPALALALQFILLTGQRRGEVAVAKWSDIERLPPTKDCRHARRLWRLPDTKNGRDHMVLLPRRAVSVLARLRRINGRSEFLLPARGSGAAPADRERSITRACRTFNDRLGLAQHFTPHDLRRTVRTNLSRLGVSQEVAERVLNHAQENLMLATYNQHRYTDEIGEALEKWSVLLCSIVGGEQP
jgi:integrase